MTTKIILDTDIGSDIDDAFCLAYLLAQKQCELLGITTVSGQATIRAQMASAMCKIAGRDDIPIIPGVEKPMLFKFMQTTAMQAPALAKWPHKKDFPQGQVLNFLRDTIRKHPGEIVLLTIGPLTNIGLLFTLDPEIPSLLKGLVMMSGVFTNRMAQAGPREWNAFVDPHATAIAYKHAVKVHRSIGLDVTNQVAMPAAEVLKRCTAPVLGPVRDFLEVWMKQWTIPVLFHDPLAAVTIFDEEICKFERGTVVVELGGSDRVQGMTLWNKQPKEGPDGPHEVALGVDVQRFFDHYFGVFK
ncbi:MAG: nucleoside hydrolase [Phycisphaeraceae bacterium]|nr:nucleoside hydrolase [Phycisphaeraceae bacterium]